MREREGEREREKKKKKKDTSSLSWFLPQPGSSPVPLLLKRDFSL